MKMGARILTISSHFYFTPFLRSQLMRIAQVRKAVLSSRFVLRPNLQIDCKIKVNVTVKIKLGVKENENETKKRKK